MNSWQGWLVSIAAVAMVQLALASAPSQAQEAPSLLKSATGVPAFDVVSIKPGKPGCVLREIGPSPNGFHIECIPLSMLIRYAFGYMSLSDERVFGEPAWTRSAAYDIDAKVEAQDAAAFDRLTIEQKAAMLQTPLKSRFQLAMHGETRSLPVYALVIAKGGPRLKPSDPSDASTNTLPTTRMRGRGKLEAHHCSIDGIIPYLSPLEGRTIVDHTGLTGKYDFTLTWEPETPSRDPHPQDEEVRPSIFTAVQEQLGLKFEPQKAPLDVLVIDHIERPSEN
jgi:uncharacterized protein (TIGR03435 family)